MDWETRSWVNNAVKEPDCRMNFLCVPDMIGEVSS